MRKFLILIAILCFGSCQKKTDSIRIYIEDELKTEVVYAIEEYPKKQKINLFFSKNNESTITAIINSYQSPTLSCIKKDQPRRLQ